MAHYFRSTGTKWANVGDWSSTASPTYTAVGAIPTATDDVIFELASANCIVDGVNRVCKSFTATNYIGQIDMQVNVTASGDLTFGSGMSVIGTGSIGSLGSASTTTITTNGYVWPNDLRIGTSVARVFQLAANSEIGGQLLPFSSGGNTTLNNFKLICRGFNVTGALYGSTNIELSGGNIAGQIWTTGALTLNAGANTVTQTADCRKYNGSLNYTSGIFNPNGYQFLIGNVVTMNTGINMKFYLLDIRTTNVTLSDDVYSNGSINFNIGGCSFNTSTSKNFYCKGIGGSSVSGDPFITSSTKPKVIVNGSGDFTYTGYFGLDIELTSGTLDIKTQMRLGSIAYSANLKRSGGNFINSTALTYPILVIKSNLDLGSTTLPFGVQIGMNIAGIACTLLSDLNFSGDLNYGGADNINIMGAFNMNCGGGLVLNNTSIDITGTPTLRLVGTGSWTMDSILKQFTQNIEIDTAGTITLIGALRHGADIKHTSGTVAPGTSILTKRGSITANAVGFSLNEINFMGFTKFTGSVGFQWKSGVVTNAGIFVKLKEGNHYLFSENFVSGQIEASDHITFTKEGNCIFTGSITGTVLTVTAMIDGTIDVADEIFATGLVQGITILSQASGATGGIGTYNLSASASLTSRTIISDKLTGVYPFLDLKAGAYQNVFYTNCVGVDSTGGQTIWSFGANLERAFNWNLGTKPQQTITASVC